MNSRKLNAGRGGRNAIQGVHAAKVVLGPKEG